MKSIKSITRIIRATALAAFLAATNYVASAVPIVFTADTPSFSLVASGPETGQSAIDALIAGYITGTAEVYKDNQGGAEEGSLLGSYETDYNNPALLDNDFTITWSGGASVTGTKYLLVKDGNSTPAWYLYDVSAWDGQETLQGIGFFPAKGDDAISHVTIYSKGNSVPDGGTTALMLGMAVTGFGFIRRKLS